MAVFFNLGSASSELGSLRILKLALFWVSRLHQTLNNFWKVPRLEKGWKTLFYGISSKGGYYKFEQKKKIL